jgi:hypothetical protein
MKNLLIFLLAATLYFQGAWYPCSILNNEKTNVGSRKGIKGACSNNELPVTCVFLEGTGIECDGPSGGYTGYNLYSLIFSACGCTTGEENEGFMKEQLRQYKSPACPGCPES